MTIRGKLRRGRRRLICRLIRHDWGEWTDPMARAQGSVMTEVYQRAFPKGAEYRECQRCPKMEWREALPPAHVNCTHPLEFD